METCLMCNLVEKGHPATVDYVCSGCVQKLMPVNGDEGRQLYDKTENPRQKKAITIIKGIK